jgi:ParB family transcriptional regulator, chromosome partitioning protein
MSESALGLKRRALGRGLGALIRDTPSSVVPPAERRVPIAEIRPNPRQPRRYFDEERIAELSESIQHQGILQPLVVRKLDDGYELIIGERRFRAAQRAGLERVPVIIKDVSDAESLEMALVENIQREELTPIEEALAYRQLMEEFHLTQEDVANRVGKSRPVVTNLLRVLNLPEEIKDEVDRGHISVGHARALLGLDTPEQQLEMARKIMRQGLSVRETETLVSQSSEPPLSVTAQAPQDPSPQGVAIHIHVAALEEDLMHSLGTKVRLLPKKKGGRIEIEYYSNEELEGLVRRLKGQ